MTKLQEAIQQQFAHLNPEFDVSLAPTTYFKIGGPAEVLITAKTRQAIIDVVTFCQKEHIPYHILGGASNILIDDKGLPGVTLNISNEEYEVLDQKIEDGRQVVRVGTGYKTALFVRQTIESGLAGLEYFLGVPGKLGGAIYNNAHYLTDLVGKHIYRVEVLDHQGNVRWMTNEECKFGYDYSIFHETKDVLLQAEFALFPGEKARSMELVREATLYRAKTQPLGEPSSGCYFRNTPNTPELKAQFPQFAQRSECPSAFLIDQAGLKGTRVGGVKVSEKHAAFFVNTGGGTSEDVKQLAQIVKDRVKEKFGVELQPEVFFLE